jgi:hypothetical protein
MMISSITLCTGLDASMGIVSFAASVPLLDGSF